MLSGVLIGLALVACGREQPRPDRTEPWPAPGLSAAASGTPARAPTRARFVLIDARIEIELPARNATPRGRVRAPSGELELDLDDLSRSSGRLTADLASLEIFEGNADTPDPDNTERARSWLELGRDVAEQQREIGRFATFTIRSLSRTSGPTKVPAGSERRGLQGAWLVRGDLALHGVRAPVEAGVSLEVQPGKADDAPPSTILIRSARPLVVKLGTHEIKPRDSRGVLLPKELPLLGESVGREARVRFELTFSHQS